MHGTGLVKMIKLFMILRLADVVNYCILMADTCGLDLDEIVRDKVKKNNEKYPVEKAFGSKEKYTEFK